MATTESLGWGIATSPVTINTWRLSRASSFGGFWGGGIRPSFVQARYIPIHCFEKKNWIPPTIPQMEGVAGGIHHVWGAALGIGDWVRPESTKWMSRWAQWFHNKKCHENLQIISIPTLTIPADLPTFRSCPQLNLGPKYSKYIIYIKCSNVHPGLPSQNAVDG